MLIQLPVWNRLGNMAGFQGMLEMMMYLFVWLITWEFIPSAERLFHSMSSQSHKSFILVHLTLAMACPSLNPLTPKGQLTTLMTRGLLKIGYLRTSTCDVGLVFTRPTLTFIQNPKMFFQNEQVVF
jgi:hypothetical protein